VLVADLVVLVTGSVAELTIAPRAPATGSVAAWTTPETVDVRPEIGDGWSPVAA
jgi:hypothetical protein